MSAKQLQGKLFDDVCTANDADIVKKLSKITDNSNATQTYVWVAPKSTRSCSAVYATIGMNKVVSLTHSSIKNLETTFYDAEVVTPAESVAKNFQHALSKEHRQHAVVAVFDVVRSARIGKKPAAFLIRR